MKNVGMVLVLLGLAGFIMGIVIVFTDAQSTTTPAPGGDTEGRSNLMQMLPFIIGGVLGIAGMGIIGFTKRLKRSS